MFLDVKFHPEKGERMPIPIVVKGFDLTAEWADCTGFKPQAGFSDILDRKDVRPVCRQACVRVCQTPFFSGND
jgi:hypothetical protein